MIVFLSRWIKQWKEHFLFFWLVKLFCICLFQCTKTDPNVWSYTFVNVIDFDFFMNYNTKIFFKFLAFFFNLITAQLLPKKTQFKNFVSVLPIHLIMSSLSEIIILVLFCPIETSFHGLFVLFVKGIVEKFKKKTCFVPISSSSFFS
jgi:hypothetical protein